MNLALLNHSGGSVRNEGPFSAATRSNSDTPALVAVFAEVPAREAEARQFAADYALPLVRDPLHKTYTYLLVFGVSRVELRPSRSKSHGPVFVDFVAGPQGYRRRRQEGRRQLLARAIGLKGDRRPKVLDATAGLGRDAFILAQLGCEVRMLERAPVVAALLRDGLQRARRSRQISPAITERLTLETVDAIDYLERIAGTEHYDVIYLDPMHPPRTKSARVKKEMQALQQVVGPNEDALTLVRLARARNDVRVVVKRPRHAQPIGALTPTKAITGKTTRYDVYS